MKGFRGSCSLLRGSKWEEGRLWSHETWRTAWLCHLRCSRMVGKHLNCRFFVCNVETGCTSYGSSALLHVDAFAHRKVLRKGKEQ